MAFAAQDEPLIRVKTEDVSIKLAQRLPYEIVGRNLVVKWIGSQLTAQNDIRRLLLKPSIPNTRNLMLFELTAKGPVLIAESPWFELYTQRQVGGETLYRRQRWLRTQWMGQSRLFKIDQIPLREYLLGVIPSEMPLSWPAEALKAQIVASQSYLLSRMKERRDARWPFDVETTVNDQKYQDHLRRSDQVRMRIEPILNEVSRLYLQKNGEPLTAFFHADCGGKTESSQRIWGGRELESVQCSLHRAASWRESFSLSEVRARLNNPDLQKIRVVAQNTSGRVERVALEMTNHRSVIMSGHQLRMALGADRVLSSNFAVKLLTGVGHEASVQFRGVGRGHGVGLCQNGAAEMAKRGYNFKQILHHYYPKSRLEARLQVHEI